MTDLEDPVTFLLRLPQDLKRQLEQRAKQENRSVNSLLNTWIEQALRVKPATSLENRQFLGKVVETRQIDPENGLARVNGIYYRYLIEGNEDYSASKNYIVIEANGNILTLRPVAR
ncbi:MAG: Arc family DNA-binding protein [Liquorilactobacillus nagelii]|uniref:Arc family DNA-binding protein n=1 Tax=Liquorilactobacillus nagelii TaxID=82688 RepID=UPI001CCD63DC|nr:Arc family DNA-binding protein [Liquorilactobacillus nagelii]MCI1633881.1 Arc family DNA-binding protein [Liquorilactobacillus nagelii]MCI1920861.1 Arc family DNA-binding protein [Liquorilactobacillus nagelii]MCI1976514.1 Arc family DNA-binding protein [Liquorilactobacillus nagelii]ULQ48603.1 Arc family DNA-binding protein [Liquorilactobacillus nagelii]